MPQERRISEIQRNLNVQIPEPLQQRRELYSCRAVWGCLQGSRHISKKDSIASRWILGAFRPAHWLARSAHCSEYRRYVDFATAFVDALLELSTLLPA